MPNGLRLQLLYVNQRRIPEIVMMNKEKVRAGRGSKNFVTWSTGVSPACNAQQTVWGCNLNCLIYCWIETVWPGDTTYFIDLRLS